MSSIRIGTCTILIATAASLTACRGVVAPGSTAGNTYGGAYSDQFATKKEEPKKADKPKDPPTAPGPHDRPGFITRLDKGRLWVFRKGSKDLATFLKGGEPAKLATLVGAGPEGMSLRGPDIDTLESYLAAAPGYAVYFKEERYFVFKADSMDAVVYSKWGGEPSKTATLVGEGPGGRSVRAPDMETAEGYVAAVTR